MTREAPRSTATAPWRGLLLALGLGLVVYLALGLVTDMGHVATALSRYRWPALMADERSAPGTDRRSQVLPRLERGMKAQSRSAP